MHETMPAGQVIGHHLSLFGLRRALGPGRGAALAVLDAPRADRAAEARALACGGKVVVALLPTAAFVAAMGAEMRPVSLDATSTFRVCADRGAARQPLWSLHPAQAYSHPDGEAAVTLGAADAVWLWIPMARGGLLLIGTDLAGDLVRFRQGDPRQAEARPTEALWGIAGERPVYLYEAQLGDHPAQARPADAWCAALAGLVSDKAGIDPEPLLPGGAPGAVVITGDDDQAFLEKYQEQLDLLGDLPITYFLHPLTRHTPQTLRTMLGRPGIEVEIHPDAPGRAGSLWRQA